jgi:hypothetical protein
MSRSGERPATAVPILVRVFLSVLLLAQIAFATLQGRPHAKAEDLTSPPALPILRTLSGGDSVPLAQAMTLYLQAFDNQPGISIPFAELNYNVVQTWLERILELDPQTQYPLLMASQLYGQVPDEAKQRQMLAFVYEQFLLDPDHRWPWLAHAVIMARHRLHDFPLALRYAKALTEHATGPSVPGWAKQMQIFLLEDMGEYEAAKALLGGLLASEAVKDPHELHFLFERLERLKDAEKSSTPSGK